MKIQNKMSDAAVLNEIGTRIAARRMDLQLTQADLAEQAGVSKRTVERIESGASAQMTGLIRLLRILELLPGLHLMIPESAPRPTDLLKRRGKERQRASTQSRSQPPQEPWSWDDDT